MRRVIPDSQPTAGSMAAVAAVIRCGADTRRFSTCLSETIGLVEETMALTTTWAIDDEHARSLAGLRPAVEAGLGFSPTPAPHDVLDL